MTRIDRTTSAWLTCCKPNPSASLRLFCLPYAGGGGTIFRTWADRLPASVEVCPVQLPGRGTRLRETPHRDLASLVDAMADALGKYLDQPFALFGHSLGAMISFELAQKLKKDRGLEAAHLFVSGRRAPHLPQRDEIIYNLVEDEFIEKLRKLNGTPPEVLEHAELMQLMIPTLRADFEIVETYRHTAGTPLSCPITAFGGLQDDGVPLEGLEAWREHTEGAFSVRMLPGDHFFLHASESLLLQVLSQQLRQIISTLPRR